MKPISLSLKGAIGIKDGIGADEIKIDFTKFVDGLVVVYGRNGSGKTTALDNLHVYPELASRPGALKSFFQDKDSHREFIFEGNDGATRRVLFSIDGSGRGDINAFLFKDGSAVDKSGKVKLYKPMIEEMYGSASLFFSSFFTAQNANNIASLTGGALKDLFSELLGFEIYDKKYRPAAKAEGDRIEKEIAELEGKVRYMQEAIAEKELREKELQKRQEELEAYRADLVSRKQDVELANTEVNKLKARLEQIQEKLKQAEELKEQRKKVVRSVEELTQEKRAEVEKITRRIDAAEEIVKRQVKIVENNDSIIENCNRIKELEAEIEGLAEKRETYDALTVKAVEVEREYTRKLNEAESKVKEWENKLTTLRAKKLHAEETFKSEERRQKESIERDRKSASLIDDVPCRDYEDLPNQCQLLAGARDARDKVAAKEDQLKSLATKHAEEMKGLLAELMDATFAVDTEKKKRDEINDDDLKAIQEKILLNGYDRDKHNRRSKEYDGLKSQGWDRLKIELETASQVVADKSKEIVEYQNEAVEVQDRYDKKIKAAEAEIAELEKKTREVLAASDSTELQAKLKAAQSDVDWRVGLVNITEESVSRTQGDIQFIQKKIDSIAEVEEGVKKEREAMRKLEADLNEWRFIEKACGKEGIPALELDAAAPELSEKGTTMLTDAYGSGWGISFQTQRPSADGKKMLEDFRIIVHTPNGEKAVNLMSGGEKVWVVRVISDAIAEWKNERRTEKILYRVLDEVDGALDELPDENGLSSRERYWKLVNATHERLGLHYTFAVTHDLSVIEAVDQRIEFSKEHGKVITHA